MTHCKSFTRPLLPDLFMVKPSQFILKQSFVLADSFLNFNKKRKTSKVHCPLRRSSRTEGVQWSTAEEAIDPRDLSHVNLAGFDINTLILLKILSWDCNETHTNSSCVAYYNCFTSQWPSACRSSVKNQEEAFART